jgi:hypothetical protein
MNKIKWSVERYFYGEFCTVCGSEVCEGCEGTYDGKKICICLKCLEDIDSRLKQGAAKLDREAKDTAALYKCRAKYLRSLVGLQVPTADQFKAQLAMINAQQAWEDRCLEETEPEGGSSWSTLCDVLNTPAAEITAPEVSTS